MDLRSLPKKDLLFSMSVKPFPKTTRRSQIATVLLKGFARNFHNFSPKVVCLLLPSVWFRFVNFHKGSIGHLGLFLRYKFLYTDCEPCSCTQSIFWWRNQRGPQVQEGDETRDVHSR